MNFINLFGELTQTSLDFLRYHLANCTFLVIFTGIIKMSKVFSWIFLAGLVDLSTALPFDLEHYPSTLIISGAKINIEQAPWQVSLQKSNGLLEPAYFHSCGGSIISEKYILTAAHCVCDPYIYGWKLRIGSENSLEGGALIDFEKTLIHENWNQSVLDYDYALLELAEPLNFTDKIKPIALPSAEDELPDGTLCDVSGWGHTHNTDMYDNMLRRVSVPIMNQKACYDNYETVTKVTPRMICTGNQESGTKGACYGDSGGPLICKLPGDETQKLFGIVSWSISNCDGPQFHNVYARVQVERQWIKAITGV